MQVLTHFPLLKSLGWALFDSLWQMAALWLLYSLLMAVFRPAASRIRHGLALWALGIGTVWTGVTFLTAAFFPQTGGDAWLGFLSPSQFTGGWFLGSFRTYMDAALPCGSTIYLLVLAGLLIRCAVHYRHTRGLTRRGLSTMPAAFRVFVSSTALQLGIGKPVKAWLSSLVDVPLTLGFLKPMILLPVAMLSQLSTQQVEAILVHELGHIRRKDYLLHLVVTVLEGLFFFNPFTRLLIRQLKKEREHCCDDLVIQFKYDPHAYVSALLSLAALHQPAHKLAIAATGGGDKWLLERARRILMNKKSASRPGTRSLLLLLFTALITTLAVYRPIKSFHPVFPGHPTPVVAASQPIHLSVSPATSLDETGYNMRLLSAPPPAANAHRRSPSQRRTRAKHPADLVETDDNNDFVVTAIDNTAGSDVNPMALIATADDSADGLSSDDRDFVLNTPMTIASGPSITLQPGTPIVPNSSFSYQYTLGDSSRSAEQQLYLQLSAQREVLAAIAQLQQQTAVQLKALTNLRTKASESVRLRNQIYFQQQKIELDYLKKIRSWQQKLQSATHVRVIVHI